MIAEFDRQATLLIKWPGKIEAGSTSNQVICLTDLLATAADITGAPVDPSTGVDSYSMLPTLLGESEGPIREATVHHSINGSFAIRQGEWKLIFCPGSGGWSDPKPGSPESKTLPQLQLYNFQEDEGETVNLVEKHPEIVDELASLLEQYIENGRSTPGSSQENVPSEHWPGLSWMEE